MILHYACGDLSEGGKRPGAKISCGSKADLRRRLAESSVESRRCFKAGGAKRIVASLPEAETELKIWAVACARRAMDSSFAEAGRSAK